MPSKSAKQAKFMRAVAHSPKFAKKVGVSQAVGKDYEMADKKVKKFSEGGKPAARFDLADIAKRTAARDAKAEDARYRRMTGSIDDVLKRGERGQARDAKEAKAMGVTRRAKGGSVMGKSDKTGRALVRKSADTMGRAMVGKAKGGKCYAKGGSVSARADGCATKGKTRGKVL